MRDVAQGRVGFGGAGRARGAIACERSGGGFVVGRHGDGVQLQGLDFFGVGGIAEQAQGEAGNGNPFQG
ncbi:hypothetical protein D3C84_933200 [compost metagenome]